MRITLLPTALSRPALRARLATIPGIEFDWIDDRRQLARSLETAEALIVGTPLLDEDALACIGRAPMLRWLQLLNAGVEKIPPGLLRDTQILCNASAALAPTVAEHALSLLLALGRGLDSFVAARTNMLWEASRKGKLRSLHGATVVIVGFGAIGQSLGSLLRPLRCRIIAITRNGGPEPMADASVAMDDIDNALAQADAIVLTLPLTTATTRLFNARRFAACARKPILINVSRGAIVDTLALDDALRTGQIGAAGLDVVDPEPLPPRHPLWSAPNLILTPHVAAGGSHDALADFIAENIQRYAHGQEPLSRVSARQLAFSSQLPP
ncbi:NAD(P)-dependent oxidoreductase [Pollutimonas bauzanensis]|uniref:Phosphoglycerate dehydrogenase n=1 Tax=Pollutimonas bauzanensis TaxID=658167 RepID=A0A1M5QBU9_9BURK|nr:NAD(P)-dependent oxidoreductase [Pollutimonas bauzanensis]SHH11400.1 Phosphoglycerate dehydrogenase [Pollutimonas bauzanensis]